MTADVRGSTAATLGRIRRLDDGGRAAVRRAVQVTVAACLGFYPLQYVVGDPTTAVYALFTAVALGGLSDLQGAPSTRTRTYLAAVAIGAVLITAGTLAAVSTAVAAAGMLVVGFTVAYAGVGGPRVAGVANGLQLFYVLPCFPPFAPDTLDQRLVGLLVGGLLLTLADRLVWPAAAPRPHGERLLEAADAVAAYAMALRPVLQSPAAAIGPELAARRAALDAVARLRLSDIPPAQRPLGPGIRDRALLAASAATRVAAGRLADLADLLTDSQRTRHPGTADLVAASGDAFAALAAALRAGSPSPIATTGVDGALERYVAERGRRLANQAGTPAGLRAGLAGMAVAESARTAVLAGGGFLRAPAPDPATTPQQLWFLHARPAELVWQRVRANLTPRSVYLQNAVRLAVGLAAARVVAGVLDLSHGFWVLLATLSLMRTSAVADRAVFLRGFVGTVGGALVAAGLLALVGPDVDVLAWALPLVMMVGFVAGPLFGVAAGQACFTVVVALLFAQVAPANWRLAEVRLADVVVGGLVGALIGAAVWPRGGGGEVRRAAAAGLHAGARVIRDTVTRLTRGVSSGTPPDLNRLAALFDQAYVQFRTEPSGDPGPDWLIVLSVVHRLADYSSVLQARHAGGPYPPMDAAGALEGAAGEVSADYATAAAAIAVGDPPPARAGAALSRRLDDSGTPTLSGAQDATLRIVDGWSWLHALADDLDRLERALGPASVTAPQARR
ncbi:FUSC family protein [Kribbella sp. NBC_01484]|uniref:FUSC family protein n=1 Tax=Kribbella sp. NBC_01484 TaxID=2903579 RepID=UPI002E380C27|nr:FUSC family protein [Kribbella sp. NBC_01484]